MKHCRSIILPLLLLALLVFPTAQAGAQSTPVVHAVLFYSTTCGHCEYVITSTIVPLIEKYGDQLQVIGLDINQGQNWDIFLSATQRFGVEQAGVPFLVIDNIYLMGSLDIPERLPGLVDTYMQQGGVDWPDLPGLEMVVPPDGTTPDSATPPAGQPAPTESPALDITPLEELTVSERFALDPAGNTLSVIVLVAMLGAVVWAVILYRTSPGLSLKGKWAWVVPALCAVGLIVASYLAYVETQQVEAVCGPVGDCNTVQESEYARLFGVLPIGVLGIIGYIFILAAWYVGRYGKGRNADLAILSLLAMTAFGTLFSIYLTFLEPFVIGATCAWCLTSALLMTVLFVLTVRPAKLALANRPFSHSPPPKRRKRASSSARSRSS